MFIVSQLQDTISIEPQDHHGLEDAARREAGKAIAKEINKKYCNKIFPELGLCISLFGILDTSEGVITYGDGRLYYKVSFQMIVFKPFVDEIVVGRVISSSRDGLQVSTGFFDNFYVKPDALHLDMDYDDERERLYWQPPDPETGGPGEAKFYLELGDEVRIRVKEERFNYAQAPAAKETTSLSYWLECAMDGAGMGSLAWW